jgi:hypothetical protein
MCVSLLVRVPNVSVLIDARHELDFILHARELAESPSSSPFVQARGYLAGPHAGNTPLPRLLLLGQSLAD